MTDNNQVIQAVLQKVAKVTSAAAAELQHELERLAQQKKGLIASIDATADRIRQSLLSLGHHVAAPRPTHSRRRTAATTKMPAKKVPPKKSKRIRRGPQELKRDAEAIYQFIKGKGSEGAKGVEIRKHHPKVGQDIRAYIQKFSGHKLKTVGNKASMRYIAA